MKYKLTKKQKLILEMAATYQVKPVKADRHIQVKIPSAVVVSDVIPQTNSKYCLIAPLTTRLKTLDMNLELTIIHEALKKPSLLLVWYLWTIDSKRLV